MKINNFITLLWVLFTSSTTLCATSASFDETLEEGTVVVIGDIQAGKSTVITSLLTEMKQDYEYDSQYGYQYASGFSPKSKNVTGLPPRNTDKSARTTTTYATYALKKNSKISFVDTRGFEPYQDNHGDDYNKIQRQAIIELNHIFKTKNIKGILLVVKFASLANLRGINLANNCLYGIADFFCSPEVISTDVSQSLAVVITGDDNDKKCEAELKKMIECIYNDSKITPKQKALFNVLRKNDSGKTDEAKLNQDDIELDTEKVIIFNPVKNESKEKLLKAIHAFKTIPSTAFKETIEATIAEQIRLYVKDCCAAKWATITFRKKVIVGSLIFTCFVIAFHYGKKTYYPDLTAKNLWDNLSWG